MQLLANLFLLTWNLWTTNLLNIKLEGHLVQRLTSLTATDPWSIVPVMTVPWPLMRKQWSTAIRNEPLSERSGRKVICFNVAIRSVIPRKKIIRWVTCFRMKRLCCNLIFVWQNQRTLTNRTTFFLVSCCGRFGGHRNNGSILELGLAQGCTHLFGQLERNENRNTIFFKSIL